VPGTARVGVGIVLRLLWRAYLLATRGVKVEVGFSLEKEVQLTADAGRDEEN
jgi:hypothetical protein